MSYLLTNELIHMTLVVPKEIAGHFQHLFESMDNLCQCSTPAVEAGSRQRQLELTAPIEWRDELERVVEFLQEKYPVIQVTGYVQKDL